MDSRQGIPHTTTRPVDGQPSRTVVKDNRQGRTVVKRLRTPQLGPLTASRQGIGSLILVYYISGGLDGPKLDRQLTSLHRLRRPWKYDDRMSRVSTHSLYLTPHPYAEFVTSLRRQDPCTQGVDVSRAVVPLKEFATLDGCTAPRGVSAGSKGVNFLSPVLLLLFLCLFLCF